MKRSSYLVFVFIPILFAKKSYSINETSGPFYLSKDVDPSYA
jgi:hypothetical protein